MSALSTIFIFAMRSVSASAHGCASTN